MDPDNKPQDKCGIFGAITRVESSDDLSGTLYAGLYALQHRGHESAGISVSENGRLTTHKDMGTVDLVFRPQVSPDAQVRFIRNNEDLSSADLAEKFRDFLRVTQSTPLDNLQGNAGIGHVRYSTTGESSESNIHPILFNFHDSEAAIAHNGNLINVDELEEIINSRGGYDFPRGTTTDTACIAALIATSERDNFFDAFEETLKLLEGAFSLVVLHDDILYAAKDRFGLRPLALGKTDSFFIVSSETCALSTVNANFELEVDPGTVLKIGPGDDYPVFRKWARGAHYRSCVFEVVYLSRPDSLFRDSIRVQKAQENMGRQLVQEHITSCGEIDVVIGVPDSGNAAALGCARELELTCHEFLFEIGIIRPHQVGRSFIEPIKERRQKLQGLKHNIVPENVNGKNVLVVDDSIVRGTTMPRLIKRLRGNGAKKIFVLIASPPLRHTCHLGVDMATTDEFIAHGKTVEQVKDEIGADYLGYLSVEGLYRAIGLERESFCDGCMTNEYPIVPKGHGGNVI